MFKHWSAEPGRLVGPYARGAQGAAYSSNELTNLPAAHSIILPRVLMLSRAHLVDYASSKYAELRRYVDSNEVRPCTCPLPRGPRSSARLFRKERCDDLLLNVVAARTSPGSPLRVALPEKSISDYGLSCS